MLSTLLEAWSPSVCMSCRRPTAASSLAAFCRLCATLVEPFPGKIPSAVGSIRAAFVYGGPIRDAVLALKHSGHFEYAPRLAALMTDALGWPDPKPDLVVPVPVHWTKLLSRGYNQAALLAAATAKLLKTPFSCGVLVRTRNTGSQAGLDAAQRDANVAWAFAVRRSQLLKGRVVLLVDDVVASGATARRCMETITAAGAGFVHSWAVAGSPP